MIPKKIGSEKVRLDIKELDMRKLAFAPDITALRKAAEDKGLTFSWLVDFNMPTIIADPNMLLQVFTNFIGNAVKFTNQGSVTVKVFKRSEKTAEFDVIDTGRGIHDKDKRMIFKNHRRRLENSGSENHNTFADVGASGLFIAMETIKLHGGRIGFESQLGKGSRFWFTLPLSPRSMRQSF